MEIIIFSKIEKAYKKHLDFTLACNIIAMEAQKHIDWDNRVRCTYYPNIGICIEIYMNICPAERFFNLAETSENGMIDQETYIHNCI